MANKSLSQTQKNVLKTLAAAENPMSHVALNARKSTMQSLHIVGYAEEIAYVEAESEWFITEAGREAIAPEEKPKKPPKAISDTLARCLAILEDGEWHTASELNTSHQNHGRLVEKGLAVMQQGEDWIKRFQITTLGREVLGEFNNN